jgi:formate dehydrogenase (NADP+) beta subunit
MSTRSQLDGTQVMREFLPQTGRVMVKDEDICVHCGLCAERCPTAAWDMQRSEIHLPQASDLNIATRREKQPA